MTAAKREGGILGVMILLLLGLGCGGVIALLPDLALPLSVLLLPGLIFLVIDRSPGWGMARAILLFQAAACVNPVANAWYQCAGTDGCMSMLATPTTMLGTWLVGGVAWLTAQVLPIGLRLLNDVRLKRYRAMLEKRREELRTEWGLDGFLAE